MRYLLLLLAAIPFSLFAQMPVIPGYFADPSVKAIAGKYYLYATTDGYARNGVGSDPLVWVSDDLVQWEPRRLEGVEMEFFWAPAMEEGLNGKFYLYHQNGVDFQGYVRVGQSPWGPFGDPIRVGGFDIEPFRDPNTGKVYLTTSSSILMELDSDPASPNYLTQVVAKHTLEGQFTDMTEGVYLYHRKGLYYLMWSGGRCWLDTYNVRYALSESILGPYRETNSGPILKSDPSRGIHGPGHHSIVERDGRTFMFYHRQDNARGNTCDYRFTCVAELFFDAAGRISATKIQEDPDELVGGDKIPVNLALGKPVEVYADSPVFSSMFATDGRFDTRWTTEDDGSWGTAKERYLVVDLGSVQAFTHVDVAFEYVEQYQAFTVKVSDDKVNWRRYSDHSEEAVEAYKVMPLAKEERARYVKLIFNGNEDRRGSLWEIRVLSH